MLDTSRGRFVRRLSSVVRSWALCPGPATLSPAVRPGTTSTKGSPLPTGDLPTFTKGQFARRTVPPSLPTSTKDSIMTSVYGGSRLGDAANDGLRDRERVVHLLPLTRTLRLRSSRGPGEREQRGPQSPGEHGGPGGERPGANGGAAFAESASSRSAALYNHAALDLDPKTKRAYSGLQVGVVSRGCFEV